MPVSLLSEHMFCPTRIIMTEKSVTASQIYCDKNDLFFWNDKSYNENISVEEFYFSPLNSFASLLNLISYVATRGSTTETALLWKKAVQR